MTRLFLFSLILSLSLSPLLLSAQISDTDTLPAPPIVSGTDGQVYNIVEIAPEYPDGQMQMFKFLQENLVYPKSARENNNEGTVTISFIVEIDGSLSNFTLKRSSGHSVLDAEAIRVAKLMPNWAPGYQQGKPVRVNQTLPVRFKLSGKEPKKRKGRRNN
jgi:TonB family protein